MIPYHGLPVTPATAAAKLLAGRHAFVSHAHPEQIEIAVEVARSFALDNGAFSAWTRGHKPDWERYYGWVSDLLRFPGFDFAVIPDSIEGGEEENDALISAWPHGHAGAPVWHLHESLERLDRLSREWPRVCIGSSGDFSRPGSPAWWGRMSEAMGVACDDGFPRTKLHGLRMMDPELRSIPFSSVDSTSVGQNVGIDGAWRGPYSPPTKEWRAVILAERYEQTPCAQRWVPRQPQQILEGFLEAI